MGNVCLKSRSLEVGGSVDMAQIRRFETPQLYLTSQRHGKWSKIVALGILP